MKARLQHFWNATPFRWVFVVALALVIIGDVYPFSPFPMYSNFSKDAQVLYITNGKDEPIPMQRVFGVRTSVAKKIYKRELKAICKKAGKKSSEATSAELALAGEYLIDYLMDHEKGDRLDDWATDSMRLYRYVITLENDKLSEARNIITERELP